MDVVKKIEIENIERRIREIENSIEVEKKFEKSYEKSIEKILASVKWQITLLATVFSAVVVAIGVMIGFINNTQTSQFQDFKADIQSEIQQQFGNLDQANIKLLGLDGNDLSGQQFNLTWEDQPPKPSDWDQNNFDNPYSPYAVHFFIVIKNTSTVASGRIATKLYWSLPELRAAFPSADEPEFKYEYFAYLLNDQNNTGINGNFAYTYRFSLYALSKPKHGRYPLKIKLYYGNGKETEATIFLVL